MVRADEVAVVRFDGLVAHVASAGVQYQAGELRHGIFDVEVALRTRCAIGTFAVHIRGGAYVAGIEVHEAAEQGPVLRQRHLCGPVDTLVTRLPVLHEHVVGVQVLQATVDAKQREVRAPGFKLGFRAQLELLADRWGESLICIHSALRGACALFQRLHVACVERDRGGGFVDQSRRWCHRGFLIARSGLIATGVEGRIDEIHMAQAEKRRPLRRQRDRIAGKQRALRGGFRQVVAAIDRDLRIGKQWDIEDVALAQYLRLKVSREVFVQGLP